MRRLLAIAGPALLLLATAAPATTFTETKLTASDATAGDFFGKSVAISGNTTIVGAYGADDPRGSAYLFDTTTGSQSLELVPPGGGNSGYSVAISGDTAIIGNRGGSAYLFDVTTGIQIAKLTASDAAYGDQFGFSVAISGKTAIVGTFGNGSNHSGAAYLFDVATGTQIAKLTSEAISLANFGFSVAISGNTAIVGSPRQDGGSGSAYLFDTVTGSLIAQLTAFDGEGYDKFGYSVGISDDTAVVGAPYLGGGGAAYLFDVTTGSQIAKLTASDAAFDDAFGTSVAISGSTVIVGAEYDRSSGRRSGSAYLFDVSTGSQVAKLKASDAAVNDRFGASVAISGNKAVVGAWLDDDAGTNSGSAYLYDLGAPVPEVPLPAGVWLLGSGIGLIALRRGCARAA